MLVQDNPRTTPQNLRQAERFLVTATAQAYGVSLDDLQVRVRRIQDRRILANLYVHGLGGWRPMLPYHVEAPTVCEALIILAFDIGATRVGVKTSGWNSFEPVRELTPSSVFI